MWNYKAIGCRTGLKPARRLEESADPRCQAVPWAALLIPSSLASFQAVGASPNHFYALCHALGFQSQQRDKSDIVVTGTDQTHIYLCLPGNGNPLQYSYLAQTESGSLLPCLIHSFTHRGVPVVAKCDPYQVTKGIFHRARTNNFTICMEIQKTWDFFGLALQGGTGDFP